MKWIYRCFLLLLFVANCGELYAQLHGQARIDSLLKELPKQKEDTNKVTLLCELANGYNSLGSPEIMKYARMANELAVRLNWNYGITRSYGCLGCAYFIERNYPEALKWHLAASEGWKKLGIYKRIFQSYGNIFYAYMAQEDFPSAIDYNYRMLKIAEEAADTIGLARVYENMCMVYQKGDDYSKALEYLPKMVALYDHLAKAHKVAGVYDDAGKEYQANKITHSANIAVVYERMGDHARALENSLKVLQMAEEMKDSATVTNIFGNIAIIYGRQKNYEQALEYSFKSLEMSKALNDTNLLAWANYEVGSTLLMIAQDTTNSYDKAIAAKADIVQKNAFLPHNKTARLRLSLNYLLLALQFEKKTTDLRENLYGALATAYKLNGDYRNALESYTTYTAIKDSALSVMSDKKILQRQMQFDFDKKETIAKAEVVKQKRVKQSLMAFSALLLLIAGASVYLFFYTRKAKNLVEKEKIRAERSEQFNKQFLANMSHEIRTPMNAVMGMTSLVLDTPLQGKQKSYLDAIKKSSDNLLHIINDILDLSKLEAGKMELEQIDFSLSDTIDQVKQTLAHRAEEKGLQLIVNVDHSIHDVLIGDPVRLSQVLINLTGNAIKFTEKGSVAIEVKKAEHGIKFSITDTGIGIPKDKLQTVFENFSQANASDTRKYGGTGLGLSISRQLVEIMGGKISIESEEGSGTTFSFTVNFENGSAEKLQQRLAAEEQVDGSILDGLSILVVDDNEYNRIVAKDTLETKSKASIVAVGSAREALGLLKEKHFDVVLMDVQMPEMNGFEATKYIREQLDAPVKNIPIIALTASVLRTDLDRCKQAGMNSYVPKPFKASQLITGIAQVCVPHGQGTSIVQKTENKKGNIGKESSAMTIADLGYLHTFCEGDEERMKKYINIYLRAAAGFDDTAVAALSSKDFEGIAALTHSFKPKWMMMGMKQTIELGQKIETLCRETPDENKISEQLALLKEQHSISVKELEDHLKAS